MNLNAVRVSSGEFAIRGTLAERNRGDIILRACVNANLKVLFEFHTPDSDEFTEDDEGEQGPLYEGGAAWGEMLDGYVNGPNPEPELAEAVIGFSLQNEFSNNVRNTYLQTYNNVLASTDPPDEVLADWEATKAAEKRADDEIRIIRWFCLGLLHTYPAAARIPGGAGNPDGAFMRYAFGRLVSEGDFYSSNGGPALTGVGVHWYKPRNAFDITTSGGPLSVTLRAPPLKDRMDAFLEAIGLPAELAATMPIYVQETNVLRTTFGVPLDDPTNFAKTKLALKALLDEQYLDSRVHYVGPFTPWLGQSLNFLISIDYAYNHPEEDPVTPAGEVVRDYVPPSP